MWGPYDLEEKNIQNPALAWRTSRYFLLPPYFIVPSPVRSGRPKPGFPLTLSSNAYCVRWKLTHTHVLPCFLSHQLQSISLTSSPLNKTTLYVVRADLRNKWRCPVFTCFSLFPPPSFPPLPSSSLPFTPPLLHPFSHPPLYFLYSISIYAGAPL